MRFEKTFLKPVIGLRLRKRPLERHGRQHEAELQQVRADAGDDRDREGDQARPSATPPAACMKSSDTDWNVASS